MGDRDEVRDCPEQGRIPIACGAYVICGFCGDHHKVIDELRKDNEMSQAERAAEIFREGTIEREWQAWRQLCKQLEAIGVDINEQDPLACAIRLWGEELVQLRLAAPEHIERALAEHREKYRPHQLELE